MKHNEHKALPLGEFVGCVAEAKWSGDGGHPQVVKAGPSSSRGAGTEGTQHTSMSFNLFLKVFWFT